MWSIIICLVRTRTAELIILPPATVQYSSYRHRHIVIIIIVVIIIITIVTTISSSSPSSQSNERYCQCDECNISSS